MHIFSKFLNNWFEEKCMFFSFNTENENIYLKNIFLIPVCNLKEVTNKTCYNAEERLFSNF